MQKEAKKQKFLFFGLFLFCLLGSPSLWSFQQCDISRPIAKCRDECEISRELARAELQGEGRIRIFFFNLQRLMSGNPRSGDWPEACIRFY
jgi:hypothetical protein